MGLYCLRGNDLYKYSIQIFCVLWSIYLWSSIESLQIRETTIWHLKITSLCNNIKVDMHTYLLLTLFNPHIIQFSYCKWNRMEKPPVLAVLLQMFRCKKISNEIKCTKMTISSILSCAILQSIWRYVLLCVCLNGTQFDWSNRICYACIWWAEQVSDFSMDNFQSNIWFTMLPSMVLQSNYVSNHRDKSIRKHHLCICVK